MDADPQLARGKLANYVRERSSHHEIEHYAQRLPRVDAVDLHGRINGVKPGVKVER